LAAGVGLGSGARRHAAARERVALITTGAKSADATRVAQPAPTSRPPRRVRHQGGPYAIGVRYLRIMEPAAPGIANGRTVAGRPERVLPTAIRYPAAGIPRLTERPGAPAAVAGPFPLIVFSQGFDTPASAYAGLLDAWARAGYVVAAPTYPYTDPTLPGGANRADIVNHPRDLRFVISALTSQARRPSSPLAHLVNERQIAVAGQSDGGDVSLAVAANSCCRDTAVKAAVILSGAEFPSFGGSYYSSGSPPLLVTQGDGDTINLPGCSAAIYDQAPVPKYYVDLVGAPHLPPYVLPGRLRSYVATVVIAFLDYYLKSQRARLLRLRQAGGLSGVATLTSTPRLAGRGTYCLP
jgi:dienelactone hydrolase